MKRLTRIGSGAGLVMGLLLAVTASPAQAQNSNGQWRATPQKSGGARPAVVPSQPSHQSSQQHSSRRAHRRPVAIVPAILMSDGSIYADFGYGFERVVRPCGATLSLSEPVVVAGNGVVLSQPAPPPTYTQPVPNQQTSSQQMLPSANRTTPSAPAQAACFNRDASGRVVVYRN